ncbi:MAG: phosphatidylglycerol---prolipoprotein diacylglyceryl transferase [Chthoniobacter sp.]|jgi:phosphatidylglycerol:prolipoprotein diacylglycerol transferase|nr:phosphatidylglycerol---prolipoprotein diacylglyceryl transferase [Chthoniobacter sp.]
MLAFYVHTLSPFIWEIRPGFGLRWYGFAYVLAFAAGFWLYRWLSEHGYSEMPARNVGDFITWGAVLGVMVGGRLGHMLFYDFSKFVHDPLMFFRVWEGGMASHGGMIGLILFTLFYARRHKLSWTSIGDNLCVVAPIGLFFGRIANFINGELYGHVTTLPWGVQFPKELYDDPALAELAVDAAQKIDRTIDSVGAVVDAAQHDPRVVDLLRPLLSPRHPSQIYEALLEGVFLFAALWFLRTRLRLPRGVITGAFFVLYAIVRIIGEIFRVPDAPLTGPFTRGQFLSFFLILIGAAFIAWGWRTQHYERAQSRATSP